MEPRKPSYHETNGLAHTNHPRYRGVEGHWIINEGGGSTAYDIALAGYGRGGSLNSGVTWTQGNFGPALQFNGSSGVVTMGDINALDGLTQLVVASWFYVSAMPSVNNHASIINKEAFTGGLFYGWGYQIKNDISGQKQIYFVARNGDTPVAHGYTNFDAFATGQWYHLVMVYDGGGAANADRLKAYLNATALTLTFSGTIPASIGATTTNVQMGTSGHGLDAYLNGRVGEARVIAGRTFDIGDVMNLYADPFLEWAYPVDDEWNTIAAAGAFRSRIAGGLVMAT